LSDNNSEKEPSLNNSLLTSSTNYTSQLSENYSSTELPNVKIINDLINENDNICLVPSKSNNVLNYSNAYSYFFSDCPFFDYNNANVYNHSYFMYFHSRLNITNKEH